MSTLLKMQKIHPLCSRCIRMYPLQNRWTVLRYLQCYENFSECCTHLILPETALFSPTPTFAKEPKLFPRKSPVRTTSMMARSVPTADIGLPTLLPTAEKRRSAAT